MLQKNKGLTDATLNLKKMTEQTKGVAGQTLVTLKEQGEQIHRIHHKAVQVDQELEKVRRSLFREASRFLCHLETSLLFRSCAFLRWNLC